MSEDTQTIQILDKENARANPKGKRRSSILKLASRIALQELDCNSGKEKELRRSRRVSFADTCQIKEVVFSHNGVTEFNLTREIKDKSETPGHSPEKWPALQVNQEEFLKSKKEEFSSSMHALSKDKISVDCHSHSCTSKKDILNKEECKSEDVSSNTKINSINQVLLASFLENNEDQIESIKNVTSGVNVTCLEDIIETSKESSNLTQEQNKYSDITNVETCVMESTHILTDNVTLRENFEVLLEDEDSSKKQINKTMVFNSESCLNLEETMCANADIQYRNINSVLKETEYTDESNINKNVTTYLKDISEITCISPSDLQNENNDFILKNFKEINKDSDEHDSENEQFYNDDNIDKQECENKTICFDNNTSIYLEETMCDNLDTNVVENTSALNENIKKLKSKVEVNTMNKTQTEEDIPSENEGIIPKSLIQHTNIHDKVLSVSERKICFSDGEVKHHEEKSIFHNDDNKLKYDSLHQKENLKNVSVITSEKTDEIYTNAKNDISIFNYETGNENEMNYLKIKQNIEEKYVVNVSHKSLNKTQLFCQDMNMTEPNRGKIFGSVLNSPDAKSKNDDRDSSVLAVTLNYKTANNTKQFNEESLNLQEKLTKDSAKEKDYENPVLKENSNKELIFDKSNTNLQKNNNECIKYPSNSNQKSLTNMNKHEEKKEPGEVKSKLITNVNVDESIKDRNLIDKICESIQYPSDFNWKSLVNICEEKMESDKIKPKLITNVNADESINDRFLIDKICENIEYPSDFNWKSLVNIHQEEKQSEMSSSRNAHPDENKQIGQNVYQSKINRIPHDENTMSYFSNKDGKEVIKYELNMTVNDQHNTLKPKNKIDISFSNSKINKPKDDLNFSKFMHNDDTVDFQSEISDINFNKTLNKTKIFDETMNFTNKIAEIYQEEHQISSKDDTEVSSESHSSSTCKDFNKTSDVTKYFEHQDVDLTEKTVNMHWDSPKSTIMDETRINHKFDIETTNLQIALNKTKFCDDDMNMTNVKCLQSLNDTENMSFTNKVRNMTVTSAALSNSNLIKNLSGKNIIDENCENMQKNTIEENKYQNFMNQSKQNYNSVLTEKISVQTYQVKMNENSNEKLNEDINSNSLKNILAYNETCDENAQDLKKLIKQTREIYVDDDDLAKKQNDSESLKTISNKINVYEDSSLHSINKNLNKSNSLNQQFNIEDKENLPIVRRKRSYDENEIKTDFYFDNIKYNKKPKISHGTSDSCTWKITSCKETENESIDNLKTGMISNQKQKITVDDKLSDMNNSQFNEMIKLRDIKAKYIEKDTSHVVNPIVEIVNNNENNADKIDQCEQLLSHNNTELSQPIGYFKPFDKDSSDSCQDIVTQPLSLLNLIPIKPIRNRKQDICDIDNIYPQINYKRYSNKSIDENNYSRSKVSSEKHNEDLGQKTKSDVEKNTGIPHSESVIQNRTIQKLSNKNEPNLNISTRISSLNNIKDKNEFVCVNSSSKENMRLAYESDETEISPVKLDLQKSINISNINDKETIDITGFLKQNANLYLPMSSTRIINFDPCTDVTFNKSEIETILPEEETKHFADYQHSILMEQFDDVIASFRQNKENNNKFETIKSDSKITNAKECKTENYEKQNFNELKSEKLNITKSVNTEIDNSVEMLLDEQEMLYHSSMFGNSRENYDKPTSVKQNLTFNLSVKKQMKNEIPNAKNETIIKEKGDVQILEQVSQNKNKKLNETIVIGKKDVQNIENKCQQRYEKLNDTTAVKETDIQYFDNISDIKSSSLKRKAGNDKVKLCQTYTSEKEISSIASENIELQSIKRLKLQEDDDDHLKDNSENSLKSAINNNESSEKCNIQNDSVDMHGLLLSNSINETEQIVNKNMQNVSNDSKIKEKTLDEVSLNHEENVIQMYLDQKVITQDGKKCSQIIEANLHENSANENKNGTVFENWFVNTDVNSKQNNITEDNEMRLNESVCSTTINVENFILDNLQTSLVKSVQTPFVQKDLNSEKGGGEQKQIRNETFIMNKMEQCIVCNPSISKTFLESNLTRHNLNEDERMHGESCCGEEKKEESLEKTQECSGTHIEENEIIPNDDKAEFDEIPSPEPLPAKMSVVRKLRDKINVFYSHWYKWRIKTLDKGQIIFDFLNFKYTITLYFQTPIIQDEKDEENCVLSNIKLEFLNIYFKYEDYLLPYIKNSFQNICTEHLNLQNISKLMEDIHSTISHFHKIVVDLKLVGVFHVNELENSILSVRFCNRNTRTIFILKFPLNIETYLESPVKPIYHHIQGENLSEDVRKICENVLPGEKYLARMVCTIEEFFKQNVKIMN